MNISQALASLRRLVSASMDAQRHLDEIKINQGAILARLDERRQSKRLSDYEFKVFSQWGEDGIIQHLIRTVPIANQTFIEFGVEDFHESNCRFLLMHENWQGFVVDGARENIDRLRGAYFYWRHHLDAVHAFITRDNVDEVLSRSGFARDVGILSIGVAGRKGYSLVGSNSAGNNAFFVRSDLVNDRLEVLTPEDAYAVSRYRESRDAQGHLTFLAGEERLHAIRGLPVFEVERGTIEPL